MGGFYYRNPHNRGNVYSVDDGETLLVGAVNGDQSTCGVVPIPKVTDANGNIVDGNVLTSQAYLDMLADPNCFSMNQIRPGGYTPQFAGTVEDHSFFAGVKGDIGEWSYDASAGMGNNRSTFSAI